MYFCKNKHLKKKSILFIVDKPDWAYEFMVKTWVPYLPEYEFFISYDKDFHLKSGNFSLRNKLASSLSNLIRNREPKFVISKSGKSATPIFKNPPVYRLEDNKKVSQTHFDFMVEMAYYFQMTSALPFTADKKIVGIFTDGYPHEGPATDIKTGNKYREYPRKDFYETYLKPYDAIIAGCNNIVRAYQPFTEKIQFVYGIYRQEEFGKKKISNSDFTIGWTGNPNREMKGFKEIILPAIEKVQGTGRTINLKTKFSGSYDELFDFYNDVDLVLIASRADSGPSLFAEASLSNIACISTAVGLPEMVIKNGENGIICERNINEFADAIIKLYDDRELLHQFSERIKEDYLKVLDNKITAGYFKNFIESV